MAVEEVSISDEKLAEINTARQQILGRCEFKDMADADMLSLPLTLTKAHVTTWCLGELPIDEDTKPYFKIEGLATDSTHADDVANLLKFEGTKYDTSLSGDDRAAADLLRRAVTRGPQEYLKPAPQREAAATAPRASPGRARWVEDSEALDKLFVENERGKPKYLCDTAFGKRKAITILHTDGSEVKLTWRGALVYQYTQAKLKASIKKFNTLLAADAKRKRGRAQERFPTEEAQAKRAAKEAKRGTRPRTNTAQVTQANEKLTKALASKQHRTEQRDAARAKYHETKQRLAFIKRELEAGLGQFSATGVEKIISKMIKSKPRAGGDQKAKWIKLYLKALDAKLPASAVQEGPDESEYDDDSESEDDLEEDEDAEEGEAEDDDDD